MWYAKEEKSLPHRCVIQVSLLLPRMLLCLKGNVAPVPGDLHGQGLGLGY